MTQNPFVPARVRAVFSLLALSAAILAIAPRACAQANANPPERIAYQGFLVDANGIPLATNAPKNYDVIFRIWNDPSATAAGNRLWTEQQTVTVDKGYFSVVLGEGTSIGEARPALSSVFTNTTASDRWVALTVKGIGSGGSDANILPRLRLIASPYAFLATKAMTVDGAGVTSGTVLDARLSTNVALRSGGNIFSGTQIINSSLGIGVTPNPGRLLAVNGAGNTGINLVNTTAGTGKPYLLTSLDSGQFLIKDDLTGSLQFWMDKVNPGFYLMGGNVGMGTTTPGFPLTFANTLGDKLSLFGQSGNSVGFGVQGGLLQIHGDVVGADIAFGYGSSAAMTETMRIKGNGNVGIGTTTPGFPLTFANTAGDKISLYGQSGNNVGFGVQGNLLQIHTDVPAADVAFGYGTSAAMSETMRIKGTGNVGIGTNAPQAKLHVAGNGSFLGSTPYVKFSDVRSKGAAGGSSLPGGIAIRSFNTNATYVSQTNANWMPSLSSTNVIRLPAGIYQCRISAPAYRAGNHQARLRISGAEVLLYGTSEFSPPDAGGDGTTRSTINGQFTLTAAGLSSLVIEHYTSADEIPGGLGTPANAWGADATAVEVYTEAEFWKLQ